MANVQISEELMARFERAVSEFANGAGSFRVAATEMNRHANAEGGGTGNPVGGNNTPNVPFSGDTGDSAGTDAARMVAGLPAAVGNGINSVLNSSIIRRLFGDTSSLQNMVSTVTQGSSNAATAVVDALNGNFARAAREWTAAMAPTRIFEGIEEWNRLNKAIFESGSLIGRTSEQMEILQSSITKNSALFAKFFNIQPDQLAKTVEKVADMTGRVRLPTVDEMFYQSYMTRFKSDDLIGSFDKLAGSTSVAAANFMKMQQNAGAYGLNLKKATETLKQNIGMMDKVTFKDGVSGLERMVLLSQQMKLNISDAVSMSNNFGGNGDIDKAIEASAKLNALGGNFAMLFSNPLEMMNLAMNDAEGLMDKLNESVKGLAVFNWNTGVADISASARMQIKALADATGTNSESLMQAARRHALQQAMLSQMNNSQFTAEQRDMITNRAEYDAETGRFVVALRGNDGSLTQKDVREVTVNDIRNIVSSNDNPEDAQLDIRDNVRDIAKQLKQRARDKSVTSMSVSEKLEAGKSLVLKPYVMLADVAAKSRKNGGAGWNDELSRLQISNSQNDEEQFAAYGSAVGEAKNLTSSIENYIHRTPFLRMIPFADLAVKGLAGAAVAKSIEGSINANVNNPDNEVEWDANSSSPYRGYGPNASEGQSGLDTEYYNAFDPSKMMQTNTYATPKANKVTPTLPNSVTGADNNIEKSGVNLNNGWNQWRQVYQPARNVSGPEAVRTENSVVRQEQVLPRPRQASTVATQVVTQASRPAVNTSGSTVIVKQQAVPKRQSVPTTPTVSAEGIISKINSYYNKPLETAKDISKYAQEVEGVVDIEDPLLANKAFMSVIKIHELLVARYGVVDLVRHDYKVKDNISAIIPRENRNLSQSEFEKLKERKSSSSTGKSEISLKLEHSGTIKLDSSEMVIELSYDTMQKIANKLLEKPDWVEALKKKIEMLDD